MDSSWLSPTLSLRLLYACCILTTLRKHNLVRTSKHILCLTSTTNLSSKSTRRQEKNMIAFSTCIYGYTSYDILCIFMHCLHFHLMLQINSCNNVICAIILTDYNYTTNITLRFLELRNSNID